MNDDRSNGNNTGIREANENKNKSEVGNNTVITPVSNEPGKNDLVKDAAENMYANNNTGKDTLKKKLELENAKEKDEDNNLESNKIKTTSK